MSTFPRRAKALAAAPVTTTSPYTTRATPSFDVGINSSNAWTEHLERELDNLSLLDIEKGDQDAEIKDVSVEVGGVLARGTPARVLYDFEGNPEFKELDLKAGDELEVLTEDLADGWSLARLPLVFNDVEGEEDEDDERDGKVGLVPRSYYTFTSEFASFLDAARSNTNHTRDRDTSSNTLTPRASLISPSDSQPERQSLSPPVLPPLIPQNTGEWFRQQLQISAVRRSLLGGKSLNRFSSFVTSGAEEWVLNGAPALPNPAESTVTTGESHEVAGTHHGKEVSESSSDSLNATSRADADKHYVDVGSVWRSKVPPFHVRVHSPEKCLPAVGTTGMGAYTIYNVTSTFTSPAEREDSTLSEANEGYRRLSSVPSSSSSDDGLLPASGFGPCPQMITVTRRFSHFVFLHVALTRLLPGITLPPLPEKQYAGRFSEAFVEARRGELERFINKIVRHPVARYAEVLMFFLSCESEVEWQQQIPHHLQRAPAGPSFYAQVYHPAFHFDAEDAEETVERFDNHARAVGRGVQQLRSMFSKVRNARVEMSNAERTLSYSILSLITSTPLASSSIPEEDEDDEDEALTSTRSPSSPNGLASPSSQKRRSCRLKKGLMDADGAWCWKDDCADCLRLTKCLQKTAETLQGVADLYEGHARRTMLTTHESLKDVAHPSPTYSPIVDIHKSTLTRYKEALDDATGNEEVTARCETVLNTTMAEFDSYHIQKKEDFEQITKGHLDNEIMFYEKVLSRLRTTRALFDATPEELDLTMPGPRMPSIYERDLAEPKLSTSQLPQPCPHVFDSSSMRPVSAAIQGGVGVLFGGSDTNSVETDRSMSKNWSTEVGDSGRRSVFSRFW